MPDEKRFSEEDMDKADEMAERLYRGIGGFTSEFKTHEDIREFIAQALSEAREEGIREAVKVADDLMCHHVGAAILTLLEKK